MRKIALLLVLVFAFSSLIESTAQERSVSFDFTTLVMTGHKRAPKYVMAIWVKNDKNEYVNSIAIYADKRIGYLSKWSSEKAGSTANAVAGATQSSQKAFTASWDLKTFVGTDAADGDYIMCFEMSSGDGSKANAYYEFPFTIGSAGFSLAKTNETYLKDIQLSFFNGQNTSATDVEKSISLGVYPNPANNASFLKVKGIDGGLYNLSVFDLTGKKVYSKLLNIEKEETKLSLSDFMYQHKNGMYIIRLQRGEQVFTKSFIYKN